MSDSTTRCSSLLRLPAAAILVLAASLSTGGATGVLFLGKDAGPTSGADAAVMSFLETRYGAANVDYLQSSAAIAGDEAGYDVLIVSSTPNSSTVRGKFHYSTVGILNWERVLSDNSDSGDFSIISSDVEVTATDHAIRIIDAAHPVTAGFTAGQVVQIASGSAELWWAVGALAPGASALAEDDGDSSRQFITLVNEGGMLLNGSAAPGRRVMFGMSDNTFGSFTADGKTLFGQAIDWAAAGQALPPTVVNVAATTIEPGTATVGGEVTGTGGAAPNVTIYHGDNDGGTDPGMWDAAIDMGSQSGPFSTGLTGLSPSTTYHFRCFAANSGGDDWADSSSSFITAAPPDPPTIANSPATNVGFTLAEVNGEVTATGGETPEVTIYWGDNDGGTDVGLWDQSIAIGTQGGAFTREVVGLTDGTTYYFRCFAENSGGPSWASPTASFTTPAFSPPVVANLPATGITGISAIANGEVTGTGGDPPDITIYFGDNDGGTTIAAWDDSVSLGPRNAAFSEVLTGLSPLTTYYFRCFAENTAGTAWAAGTRSFTTNNLSQLIINEFLAANDGTYSNYPDPNQEPGRTDDWIEILNTGTTTLQLAGWHLTDDPGEPAMWTFPAGTSLGAGEFLLVYASGDGAPDSMGNLHTNFKLGASGEYAALVRPDLSIASEFGPGGSDYPAQNADVSYGIHPSTALPVFFSVPTPGAANDAGGQARVADTRFSIDRGIYNAPFDVTISTGTPGATIYYTTDGEDPITGAGAPTPTASVYGAPVNIPKTTVLRAAAVMTGLAPTNIDTHTYILIDIAGAGSDGLDPGGLNAALLEQTIPAGYPPLDGDGEDAADGDYDMDQTISKSADQATNLPAGTSRAQALIQGLVDIPTLSIAMNIDDFAGPDNGLYTHAVAAATNGAAWERACSAELIQGDNSEAWQEDCGIRAQGGASRNRSPKHAMSLRFREIYGAGKLCQKLFAGSSVEEFNVLSIRAGYNNSWIHRNAGQRDRGSMIRDQWARDTMLEMGHPDAGHGMMVHLYVNGLYWGVHNLSERQDASHYAAYHGGDEDLIDARNAGSFIDGNDNSYDAAFRIDADDGMVSVVESGDWTKIQQVLDIDTHIDYQIMNRFGGNGDLSANNNWRAAGGGPFPAGQPELMAQWQVYSWDAERTLEAQTRSTEPNDPTGLRATLLALPEYKIRFADRLQKHFFNGGALTTTQTMNRWMARAAELDRPIIAEAARWGDHRQDVGTAGEVYDRNDDWLAEQARMFNSYFPVRSANVLQHYRNDGYFPNTDAPVFLVNATPQHGGEIPGGGTLSITAGSGDIYYTTDGSDPRLEGGAPNPAATLIASGSSVTLPASGLVRTRALDGGEWSALEEAVFYVEPLAGPGDLAVTEIHYHPYRADALEKAAGAALPAPRTLDEPDDFEFIEIHNISAGPVNLDETAFSEAIDFTFGNLALPAGGYALVVRDAEAFGLRYPGATIAGTFNGKLANEGERLFFTAAGGDTLTDATYDNSGQWPGRPDGEGSSLEIIDPAGDPNDSENWRASCEFNGSPGSAGIGVDGRVVINEIFSHSDLPEVDAIELHNTTTEAIDITGWFLSDDTGTYPSFAIPPTTLSAGEYVVFDESHFNRPADNTITAYAGTLAAAPVTVTSPNHGLTTGDVITIEGYGGISAFNDTFEVTVTGNNEFTIDTPFLDDHSTRGHWISGRPFALNSSRGEDLRLLEADPSGRPLKFVDRVGFGAAFTGETLGRWPDGGGTGTLVTMTADTLGSPNSGARIGPVTIEEVMYHPSASPEDPLEFVEIYNSGSFTENLAEWRLRGGADFDFTSAHSLAPGDVLVVVAFDPLSDPAATATFRATYGIDAAVPLVGPFTDGPLGNDTGTVRLQRPDSPPADDPTFYPQVTEDEVIYLAATPWPTGPAGGGQSLNRAGVDLFGNFATSWTGEIPTPGGKRYDYDGWSTFFFGPGAPALSGENDDFDYDGIDNLLEFALGLNPLAREPGAMPVLVFEGDNVTMSYTRQLLRSGVVYRVEKSFDLLDWSPVDDVLVPSGNFTEIRKASVPMASHPRLFLRLVVAY